uniref:Uncharacterized protein n=1 Tax=Xenopus tropicalis TaxID=8364 RepID=A0A803JA87_XENTR
MEAPPGIYSGSWDTFSYADDGWTPQIPTDPRENTLFWQRCQCLGLSADVALTHGLEQLVRMEADLEADYYVLQSTMHQPGGRYKYSPYTVRPHSWEQWQELWDQLDFCNYNIFVGAPEEEFWDLYRCRFKYIGMNDTEERRDWLAELVYRELDIIRDYVGILRFEDHCREEMLARAQNLFCYEQAKSVLGAVGPRDSHFHLISISAGVGEEQKTSQTTKMYCPGEPGPTDVCNLRQGDVTQEMIPGLAEPERSCCKPAELAEAEGLSSEKSFLVDYNVFAMANVTTSAEGSGLAECEKVCMEERGGSPITSGVAAG